MLELNSVSVTIEGRSILKNINFTLKHKECVVLSGENGSGKSTLLKVINGAIQPTSGTITRPKTIKTLEQTADANIFLDFTIYENFLMYRPGITRNEVLALLHPKLHGAIDALSHRLSGGEKQLMAIALIASNPPDLLLLDEHTSALDPVMSGYVMMQTLRLIQEHHITCLMISHHTAHHEVGDRHVWMRGGGLFGT